MDLIRIRGLEIDCVIGVLSHEREREQRIHLDLALGLDLAPAGRTGRIALTCNYDDTADAVIVMLKFRRYRLIEMATEEIAAMLLGVNPVLDLVDIRLDKPAALDGRARAASIEVERTRETYPSVVKESPFGSIETLLETREAGLYLYKVEPGLDVRPSLPTGSRSLEWLVAGDMDRDGLVMTRNVSVVGGGDEPTYVSTGTESAVLFRCICPPAAPPDRA